MKTYVISTEYILVMEVRKKVKETIDAYFNDAYAIVENGNVAI